MMQSTLTTASTASSSRARLLSIAFTAALLPLTGCLKKPVVVATAPPPPPIMVSVPPPTHPTEPEPQPEVVETPTEPTPPPPPRRTPPRRRPTPAPVPPVVTATNTPPANPAATVDLGQLTTGGESNNAPLRQQTDELLKSQQRRLITLPSSTVSAHSEQIEQARLFLRQADEAWKKQDIEGARTLATKAKVLLDEIGE